MDLLHFLLDFILHLDRHLIELLARFDLWLYAILFLVIYAETGLVVTPFLPGDSLLFGVGALSAIDSGSRLSPWWLMVLMTLAAVLGNTTNYAIGRVIGQHAFSGRYRFIKLQYLRQTEAWFTRYGATTVLLSRFAPIVRTFAPFVAGVGRMPYATFQAWNVAGAVAWVGLFVWGGYFVGNIPLIRDNFGVVTLVVIAVSLLPLVALLLKRSRVAE